MGTVVAILALASAAAPALAADPVYYPSTYAGAPISEAVQVGDILFVSPVLGLAAGLPPALAGGLEEQTKAAMDQIGRSLAKRGLSYDNVFRCALSVVDSGDPSRMAVVNKVYTGYFKPGRFPARALTSPANLPLKADLTVECWAHVPAK
jgi:2-iminobutanoate/2-iminopropanoate deaminase